MTSDASLGKETNTLSFSAHPAFGVTNIAQLIPVTLNFNKSNYKMWTHFVKIALTKFSLLDFIKEPTSSSKPTEEWVRLDAIIQSWIFTTITPDLCTLVFTDNMTAATLWASLSDMFNSNKETRALTLTEDFTNLQKGTLTIHEYCTRKKDLADQLNDVGHIVTSKDLIINILRGLPSPDYENTIFNIPLLKPFPTFGQCKDLLTNVETRLTKTNPSQTASAFITHNRPSPSTQQNHSPHRPYCSHCVRYGHTPATCYTLHPELAPSTWPRGRGGRRDGGGRGYRGGGRNGGGRGNPQQSWSPPPSNSPAPPAYNFYGATAPPTFSSTGSWQWQWVPPTTPSSHAQPSSSVAGSSTTSADPNLLIGQFQTMGLQPATATWFMDSGASAHMTNQAGTLSSIFNLKHDSPVNVVVGNGSVLPIHQIGQTNLPHNPPFKLQNVLLSPHLYKNLISVRKFTTDNNCSIEFDPFGFSVKDLQTKAVISRFNSTGDLYPLHFPRPAILPALTAATISQTHGIVALATQAVEYFSN